ncbi:uncharacterized protein LOC135155655 [Lytechinus pictus]|uniref:uncharacterized protein LOC135155655 n=1 Tax=Lytechinus pictus TaxID=7653 RepID=UPI0030B9FB64
MDDFVKEKLVMWGLERFLENFEEQEIDQETLLLLDDQAVKADLIKPLGPRSKLLQRIKELKGPSLISEDCTFSEDIPSTSNSSLSIPSGSSTSIIKPPEVIPSTSNSSTSIRSSSSSTSKPPEDIPNTSNSSVSIPSSSSTSIIKPPEAKKIKMAHDIRAILSKRREGEELIKEMEEGCISYNSRKLIVNTLVSHLIETYTKWPKTEQKLAMAKCIVTQFPALDNDDHDAYLTWFTPASQNKTKDSSGYIEMRLRNVRYRDPARTPKESNKKVQANLPNTEDLDLSSDKDEEVDAKIKWLQDHKEPRQQVRSWMRDTCKARAGYIRDNKDKPVQELLLLFPRLIDTEGMVDQDFRILFPQSADKLFLTWPKFCRHVLNYAEKQVDWRLYLNFKGAVETDEQEVNLSLQVLPMLFPPGKKKGAKGRSGSSTKDEARKAFVQRKEIGTNIPGFLDQKTQTQPFVLIQGEIDKPEQVFVVVENSTIPCTSLLKGIDICMKLVYILDMDYAWQCQHVWDFLQKNVYKLGQVKGRGTSVPAVTLLKTYLENKVKEV